MGKEVEQVALERNHTILHRIDNAAQTTSEKLAEADAVIEFTTPDAAPDNILKCIEAGIPVVAGTTGWYDRFDEVSNACKKKNAAMLTATNFSLGVNILFRINEELAAIMDRYPNYEARIRETHHTQKLDAPSGTAVTLANAILQNSNTKKRWKGFMQGDKAQAEGAVLPVVSIREGDVKGIHEVSYRSAIDELVIRHEAFSRKGFALGAVLAAEWLIGKTGVFTMRDVIS